MRWRERVLHYARLDALRVKVPRLLEDFDFVPLGDALDRLAAAEALHTWSPTSCHEAPRDG
jgi:hypothetical protein